MNRVVSPLSPLVSDILLTIPHACCTLPPQNGKFDIASKIKYKTIIQENQDVFAIQICAMIEKKTDQLFSFSERLKKNLESMIKAQIIKTDSYFVKIIFFTAEKWPIRKEYK